MATDERRRDGEFPAKSIVLAWAAVCLILMLTGLTRVIGGRFPDPDDVLRLVQVRDLIGGQGWFDLSQYRISPPHGTPMHWSRLVDLPLVVVIAVLSPLLGQAGAEMVALIAVPFLTLAVVAAAIGRLAWRLHGARAAIFSVLACGFLPMLLFQFQPMRIDHHGWQVASVAVALWAVGRRNPRRSGWFAGLAMAFGASISLEILPLAAAFALVLWLRWLRDDREKDWLVFYMAALALGLVLLYLGTHGLSTTAWCDAVSPAHLVFFAVAACGTWAIARASRLRGTGLAILFAGIGALAAGAYALVSPQCLATPFATLDPVVDRYWYRLVLEGQPVWKQDAAIWFPALVQLIAAIMTVLVLRARAMDWTRKWWGEYLLLLLCAAALGVVVTRSLAFASVLAAIPLGWLASSLLLRLRQRSAPFSVLGIFLAILVLLAPAGLVSAVRLLFPAQAVADAVTPTGQTSDNLQNVGAGACDIYGNATLLDGLEPGTIFAPLDIGPAILLETRHSVVATGHHRAADAIGDVIAAFLSDEQGARRIMAQREADYLVLCTDMAEARIYAQEAPGGFAARLMADDAPAWLERVDLGGPREFAVYRIGR